MPQTPAQARFNKLKKIYDRADNERKAELDHQQPSKDGRSELPSMAERPKQTDKLGA